MGDDPLIRLEPWHLDRALSTRGTLGHKQFQALGYKGPFKGWGKKLIDKVHKQSAIEEFMALKNAHVKKRARPNKAKKKPKLRKLTPEENKALEGADSIYTHPKWIEKRKIILKRDKLKCVSCGVGAGAGIQLNVHHLLYERGHEVWDVPDWYLITLCRLCHRLEHSKYLTPPKKHW